MCTTSSSTSTNAKASSAKSTASSRGHSYVLEWDMPFQRIAYWNKFGQPAGYFTRIDDYWSAASLWWIDPEKDTQLRNAVANPSVTMTVIPVDRYWQEYANAGTERQGPGGRRSDEVTSYFLRRLLLIIPTFLGITMAVFVIMHFVPGGPVERQIMRMRMAAMTEGGAVGGGEGRWNCPEDAIEQIRRVLRLRQAGAHPVRAVALERAPSQSRQLLHLSGSGVGRHQVAVSRFRYFSVSPGFLLSYLVCVPLGVLKAVRHGTKFDLISSVIVFHGLLECRAGRWAPPCWCSSAAAVSGASFRSAASVGQLGVSVASDRRSSIRRAHVPAGAVLHGRRIRHPDDPDQELADGKHVAGLHPNGVRQGSAQAPRDLRACAAQLTDSDRHRASAACSA